MTTPPISIVTALYFIYIGMSAIYSNLLNDYNWIYKRFDTPHTTPVTVYILFFCELRHFGGWG